MRVRAQCMVVKEAAIRAGWRVRRHPIQRTVCFLAVFSCFLMPLAEDRACAQQGEPPAIAKPLPASPSPKPLNSRSGFVPLSGKDRWNYYANGTLLSPGPYFVVLGMALGEQAANEPKEWGGGWSGYGRRAASSYGIFLTQETIHQSMAAALRTDPRYLRCNCKNGWHRSWNAIEMTLLTRDNRGRLTVDAPQIAGAYGSGMISTYWYPSRYSPTAQGLRIGSFNLALVAGVNIVKEFSPELKRLSPFKH